MEEKAASFYLGRLYDVGQREVSAEAVNYDPRDLTTHAVCLGMTGSGKTGLAMVLLEEAALDGIPCILIDPKGDLGNLLLTFPQLRPDDFGPWVNPDDARRKGLTSEAYAEQVAQSWSKGIRQWGQTPERIQRLRDASEFVIYTPGSDAGVQVSILQSFEAPKLSWDTEEEGIREKIQATVSGLLGLVGIEADPIRSREHVLLANLFEHAWRAGEDLDLAKLILLIQDPPVRKIGLFDVDTYFPQKDRFELAIALNNLIAAPGFENWLEGQPLDIQRILYGENGRPRVSVFYIAHLSDAERMFFVTLLLGQVQAWMRMQSGTTSLRCLVYFDELFGYFPPHPANPPSKALLLRLLKEARAFGVGMFLTTQNPVDLDYKGLTNAGTWFIGKLQTDRDKLRVLEGLETVDAAAGSALDRADYDRLITSLDQRVFILHNVHEPAPQVFMTRWALSYLRGPLTKVQIRELMDGHKETVAQPPAGSPDAGPRVAGDLSRIPPRVDPDVAQFFVYVRTPPEEALRGGMTLPGGIVAVKQSEIVYYPHLLAWADVTFSDSRSGVSQVSEYAYLLSPPEQGAWVDWGQSRVSMDREELLTTPEDGAIFADLPPSLSDPKALKALSRGFRDFVYREARLPVMYNRALKLYAHPDESQGRFVQRCQEHAASRLETELEKVRARYRNQRRKVEGQLQREQRELQQDEVELEGRKREEMLSIGESLLGALTGKRRSSILSSATRRRRLTSQSQADVEESKQVIAELEGQLTALASRQQTDEETLESETTALAREIEEVLIKPRKSDVRVSVFGVAWVPYWRVAYEDGSGDRQTAVVPAFSKA